MSRSRPKVKSPSGDEFPKVLVRAGLRNLFPRAQTLAHKIERTPVQLQEIRAAFYLAQELPRSLRLSESPLVNPRRIPAPLSEAYSNGDEFVGSMVVGGQNLSMALYELFQVAQKLADIEQAKETYDVVRGLMADLIQVMQKVGFEPLYSPDHAESYNALMVGVDDPSLESRAIIYDPKNHICDTRPYNEGAAPQHSSWVGKPVTKLYSLGVMWDAALYGYDAVSKPVVLQRAAVMVSALR